MVTEHDAPAPRILYEEDLRPLGIKQHRNTLARWEHEGKFPKRLAISRTACWAAQDVYDWLAVVTAGRTWPVTDEPVSIPVDIDVSRDDIDVSRDDTTPGEKR